MARVTVKVTNSNGILQSFGSPITVSTSAVSAGEASNGSNRFDGLDDVVEIAPQEGNVPVYDADTDKYVVGPVNLDGGEF